MPLYAAQHAKGQSVAPITLACIVCGEGFHPKNKVAKCCGPACRLRQRHLTRSANARLRNVRTCERCGCRFQRRNPSGKARKGLVQEGRFCSRVCSAAAIRVYASSSEAKRADNNRQRAKRGLRPIGTPPPELACVVCDSIFTPRSLAARLCSEECKRRHARTAAVSADTADRTPRPCAECAHPFSPVYGDKRRTYCSKRCLKRAASRIGKAARRSKLRQTVIEPVNPTKVFDRDNWQCQLCGVDTPRKLRGSIDPSAPEMDHIVPVSKGGAHTYVNVQCCCRRCNAFKGDKTVEQLLVMAAGSKAGGGS